MRKHLLLSFALLAPSCFLMSSGCRGDVAREFDANGEPKLLRVRNTFLVVDDEDVPVPDVFVESWSLSDYQDPTIRAWTDASGHCTYTEKIWDRIDVLAMKPGYYRTFGSVWIGDESEIPPTNHFTIRLRKAVHPITLSKYETEVRVTTEPVGFDLVKQSFLPPRGSGEIADVLLSSTISEGVNGDTEFRCIIDFPNTGDGIVEYHHQRAEGLSRAYQLRPISEIPQGFLFTNHYEWVEKRNDNGDLLDGSNIAGSTYAESPDATDWCCVEYVFKIRTDAQSPATTGMYGYLEPMESLKYRFTNRDNTESLGVKLRLWYWINSTPGERCVENTATAREEIESVSRDYRPPPSGPAGDFFELPSRSVGSHSNSLGMRISDGEVGGVRFALDPVRNRDFLAFRRDHDSAGPGSPKLNRKDRPVVMVTAEDAEAFCVWLTARERAAGNLDAAHEYRLPGAGEWLLAAGIGEQGMSEELYPWGQDPNPSTPDRSYWKAQGVDPDDLPEDDIRDDGYAFTSPVGHFRANCNGLHDMGGNVWEICCAGDSPEDGYECRGGSWRTQTAESKRLGAVRAGYDPSYPADDIGFRVVVAPVNGASLSPSRQ